MAKNEKNYQKDGSQKKIQKLVRVVDCAVVGYVYDMDEPVKNMMLNVTLGKDREGREVKQNIFLDYITQQLIRLLD